MVSIGALLLGPPHRLGIGSIDPIRADAGFADFLKTLKRSIVVNPGGFGKESMLVLKDPKGRTHGGHAGARRGC